MTCDPLDWTATGKLPTPTPGRPERRNAFAGTGADGLVDAFGRAGDKIGAPVLAGAGRAPPAGTDLSATGGSGDTSGLDEMPGPGAPWAGPAHRHGAQGTGGRMSRAIFKPGIAARLAGFHTGGAARKPAGSGRFPNDPNPGHPGPGSPVPPSIFRCDHGWCRCRDDASARRMPQTA